MHEARLKTAPVLDGMPPPTCFKAWVHLKTLARCPTVTNVTKGACWSASMPKVCSQEDVTFMTEIEATRKSPITHPEGLPAVGLVLRCKGLSTTVAATHVDSQGDGSPHRPAGWYVAGAPLSRSCCLAPAGQGWLSLQWYCLRDPVVPSAIIQELYKATHQSPIAFRGRIALCRTT